MFKREEEFFNQPKLERVKYLGTLGFNIPRLLETIAHVKDLSSFYSHNSEKKFSIRTQNEKNSTSCPHFPNMVFNDLMLSELTKLIRKGYQLLIFEAIDPEFAIRKGNLSIDKPKYKVYIEYIEGPGTVRDIDNGDPKKIVSISFSFDEWLIKEEKGYDYKFLGHSPSKFIRIPLNNFIIEFSIYSVYVGIQQIHEIFWEIRRGI